MPYMTSLQLTHPARPPACPDEQRPAPLRPPTSIVKAENDVRPALRRCRPGWPPSAARIELSLRTTISKWSHIWKGSRGSVGARSRLQRTCAAKRFAVALSPLSTMCHLKCRAIADRWPSGLLREPVCLLHRVSDLPAIGPSSVPRSPARYAAPRLGTSRPSISTIAIGPRGHPHPGAWSVRSALCRIDW
jgi:hypothetical protein